MQEVSKARGSIVLVVVAALCLVLGGVFAWAEGDTNPTGANQLRVVTATDANEDIASASVPVHIYRIASASKDPNYDTYNYTFDIEAFKSLRKDYDQATAKQEDYLALAVAAKAMVEGGAGIEPYSSATATVEEGSSQACANFNGLADGLYLVLASEVQTSTYSYTFTPAIVSLPAKVNADGSAALNTSEGSWTNATDPPTTVEVVVKHEEEQLFGDLVVNKSVNNFSGEAATFVFHVYDSTTNGEEYDRYVAVQFSGGETASATLPHIPAGLELTVEEEYTGARYQAQTGAQQVTIVANEEVGVGFVNARVEGPSGHGIENSYTLDEETGDWILTPKTIDSSESRPASS